MPRKKGDAGNDSGNASIRAFFTATPVRERTDSASANSSTAPPQRAAAATGNPKSSQIHSTGGNARSAGGAGGSARAVQRQILRAESDEGEEVDYSGTCFCSVHVCTHSDQIFLHRKRRRSRRGSARFGQRVHRRQSSHGAIKLPRRAVSRPPKLPTSRHTGRG